MLAARRRERFMDTSEVVSVDLDVEHLGGHALAAKFFTESVNVGMTSANLAGLGLEEFLAHRCETTEQSAPCP